MPPDSYQKTDKLRREQRVHIFCEVQIGNAIEKVDLPFVVGVMADLSGQPDKPLPEFEAREFTDVDKKNFDSFLQAQGPRLAFSVPNRITDQPETKLAVELNFRNMGDFSPEGVVRQIEPLRKLLEMRESLHEIRARVSSKAKLRQRLEAVLRSTEEQMKLARAVGYEHPAFQAANTNMEDNPQ